MEDPKIIIYIILIVGSFIWQFVKKSAAKKEKTTQPQPAQTSKPKSLEDIFRELAGEDEPQPQPVVVQPMPQYVANPRSIMNDALALEKRVVMQQPVIQQELPQRTFDVDLENANDWQRAFVYSEIFNRKY